MRWCHACTLSRCGDCTDPRGAENKCFCFAQTEMHRLRHQIDDGMDGDAEKDSADGGLVDGGRYERLLGAEERQFERRTGIPNLGR